MKNRLPVFAALLLLAAPAIASDAPTTQPATSESHDVATTQPATQPANVKPSSKEKKTSDEPARGKVSLTLKNAADVWILFPRELRPKEGKLTEEQFNNLQSWIKEHHGKYNAEVQFTSSQGRSTNFVITKRHEDEYWLNLKGPRLEVTALAGYDLLEKQKNRLKIAHNQTLAVTFRGHIDELKATESNGTINFTIRLKDPKIISRAPVPKN